MSHLLQFIRLQMPFWFGPVPCLMVAPLSYCLQGKPASMKRRVLAANERWLRHFAHGVDKLFVKRELRGGPCKFKPRVICSVDPIWTHALSPYLTPVDDWIHQNQVRGFGKWLTNFETAQWMAKHIEGVPNVVSLDYSSFDLHFRSQHFALESILYEYFHFPAELVQRIFEEETSWGGRAGLTGPDLYFRVDGAVRQSGDNQTSLGNNFVAIATTFYVLAESYRAHCHADRSIYKQDLSWLLDDMIGNGDDQIFVDHYCCNFDLYKSVGFDIELGDGSFCQSKLLHTDNICVMVRDPRQVLTRCAFTSNSRFNFRKHKEYMLMVAIANSYFVDRVPIYQALYSRIYELTKDAKFTKFDFACLESYTLQTWTRNMHAVHRMQNLHNPSSAERIQFCQMFGISPDKQIDLEQRIGRMELVDDIVVDWLVDYLSQ